MPLEPWIIEEIEREERRRREQDRPQPQLPLDEPPPDWKPEEPEKEDDGNRRGVTIIRPDGTEESTDKGASTGTIVLHF